MNTHPLAKTPANFAPGGPGQRLATVGDPVAGFRTFTRDGISTEVRVGEGHYYRHGRHWTTRVVDYPGVPNTVTVLVDELSGWERWVKPTESLHDAIDSFNGFLTNAEALMSRSDKVTAERAA